MSMSLSRRTSIGAPYLCWTIAFIMGPIHGRELRPDRRDQVDEAVPDPEAGPRWGRSLRPARYDPGPTRGWGGLVAPQRATGTVREVVGASNARGTGRLAGPSGCQFTELTVRA